MLLTLVFVAAAHAVQVPSDADREPEYRACPIARQGRWHTLLTYPPAYWQILQIAQPAVRDGFSGNAQLFWFDKSNGHILLCEGHEHEKDGWLVDCPSKSWEFQHTATGWKLVQNGYTERECAK